MSTFAEISYDFSQCSEKLRNQSRSILFAESRLIMSDLRSRSPVDTGFFRSNWRVQLSRFSSSSTFASITIANDTLYAYFMEYGAPMNAAPWYYPHRDKKTGRFRKGTGKLKRRGDRVWAGGKNPGHAKTIGGAIGPALISSRGRIDRLTKKLADSIISGIR
jgi:hypothetical protein